MLLNDKFINVNAKHFKIDTEENKTIKKGKQNNEFRKKNKKK